MLLRRVRFAPLQVGLQFILAMAGAAEDRSRTALLRRKLGAVVLAEWERPALKDDGFVSGTALTLELLRQPDVVRDEALLEGGGGAVVQVML